MTQFNLDDIYRNVDRLLLLDNPRSDSEAHQQQYLRGNKHADVFDILEALKVLKLMFAFAEQTSRDSVGNIALNLPHYKGDKTYNVAKDVIRDIRAYFLHDRDHKRSFLKNCKNANLVTLLLEPIVLLLAGQDHKYIFDNYNSIIDDVTNYIVTHDKESKITYDELMQQITQQIKIKKAVAGIMALRT